MRSLYVVAALALGALPLVAQSGAGSGKSIKDEDIDFTSRSSLPGSMKGRLSQHFPSGYFAGLQRVATFEFNSQDQDAATQETFVFEIRPQDPTTNFPDWPAPTPAPIYSLNMMGPVGSGITAWHWTVTPAGQLVVPSSTGNPFYMVWEVPINNLWTNDGVSIQMGIGQNFPCGTTNNPACCGSAANPMLGGYERPRTGITENVSPADTPAGPLAFAASDRNYYHWITFASPTLQGLAVDPTSPAQWFCPISNPNGGHAAMHPDVNDAGLTQRFDDIGFRVRGGATFASGGALILNSAVAMPTPLATQFGDLWLDPLDRFFSILLFGPITLDGTGRADLVLPLGAANSGARQALAGFGSLHTQAFLFSSNLQSLALSNLNTMNFEMVGSTAFKVDAATPVTFPLGSARNIQVQNDGNGHITVEFQRAGIPLGSMRVIERTRGGTGGITQVPPGTTDIKITTLNANTTNPTAGSYRLL